MSEPRDVGVNFVDILFALVVGQGLVALNRALEMPAAGISHLIFATILTIASWIGYHGSSHRYTAEISFDVHRIANLIPLAKFTLDILLVVLYWVAVQTTEWGFSAKDQSPSWHWSGTVATAVFAIYVMWDYLAWIGTEDNRGAWVTPRRLSTVLSFAAVLIVLLIAFTLNPRTNIAVTLINAGLTVIVILYRVAKDSVATRTSIPATAVKATEDDKESVRNGRKAVPATPTDVHASSGRQAKPKAVESRQAKYDNKTGASRPDKPSARRGKASFKRRNRRPRA